MVPERTETVPVCLIAREPQQGLFSAPLLALLPATQLRKQELGRPWADTCSLAAVPTPVCLWVRQDMDALLQAKRGEIISVAGWGAPVKENQSCSISSLDVLS